MEITKLSGQGLVQIPASLQTIYGWQEGQEILVIDTGEGILLKAKKPFPETQLEQVAGCLKYQGEPQSIEAFNDAIRQGIEEVWYDRGCFSFSS
ncbi:AbrB/MazE/SpoVT family DNA-binding domain-containing protein [Planktothrix sp. PCC 11201]|uniref:AbrB/MazE/SpoVT family DNA-binding domain-containing protein n=1 Tax=Planktothrix sp. PCC 11201 TaxID=1729650 RepID=UPI0009A7C564|nr:AbrB/MazE/SpoVT family DNA-binding domain-containing protein [Planktothrix sp. PCC 11201]